MKKIIKITTKETFFKLETGKGLALATLLSISLLGSFSSVLIAQTKLKKIEANKSITVEVQTVNMLTEKKALKSEKLSYVGYNKDKSLFVGYYQDGWSEMVSLHDTKTKKQLGSVYCDGGVPKNFRFSKCNKFLGAKTSVGWYVWKIPSFEKVFILGDFDFVKLAKPENKKKQ